jgi:transcriptional regulator with XRE-family HTH domain
VETFVLERSVTERARRHGERLHALREATGISKGRLMDALGFKSSRAYDLYEDGTSVIRLDRFEDWAEAFGIGPIDFLVVLLDLPDPTLRARCLEAIGRARIAGGQGGIEQMARSLEQLSDEDREHVLRTVAEALSTLRPDLIE